MDHDRFDRAFRIEKANIGHHQEEAEPTLLWCYLILVRCFRNPDWAGTCCGYFA